MINAELRTPACGGHAVAALIGELDTTDAITAAAAVMALAPAGQQLVIDLGALQFPGRAAEHAGTLRG